MLRLLQRRNAGAMLVWVRVLFAVMVLVRVFV